jgi:diguanylate cyclase
MPPMWTVLGYAALALALAGGVALVVLRLGRPAPMSWLDATMGAASAGALAVPAGPAVAIGAGGVTGVLALSRWRLQPEPVAPGPQFSPVVLAAVLTFAAIGLALLMLGQFDDISPVAASLAAVTVLTGMARAGLTVTERLRASRKEAVTDDLTGLGNRRHLLARLDRAIADAQRDGDELALLLIDLDGFKELNDTLGHHAGDEVLRQIGPRLAEALREHDTLARLGGDEFAVVLHPGDEAAASAAGLRLRAALERSFAVGGMRVHIDASIGIAMFPAHASDGLGLLQRADVAMYEAKRTRTGHEVYLRARDRHSRERLELLGELRDALDAGELVLHYQPKAEIATGAVRGVEALVRWAHPRRGLLAPDEFLPLAEQSGLGRALTAFVVDLALAEIAASGLDLTVAVNLGPADLLDLGLPSEVDRLLRRRRFAPEQLRLEVSEDVVMADPERTLEVLGGLREIGVATALDDFGAGHASLGHLKALRVDELKIDRSFVIRLPDDERDQAIVHATVELGRRLGMRVVAEGVETVEAWDALAVLACDEAQGFYLGRAMPADALAGWLGARTRQSRAAST